MLLEGFRSRKLFEKSGKGLLPANVSLKFYNSFQNLPFAEFVKNHYSEGKDQIKTSSQHFVD